MMLELLPHSAAATPDVKVKIFQVRHYIHGFGERGPKIWFKGIIAEMQVAWGVNPTEAIRGVARFVVREQDTRMAADVVRMVL